jgi:DTW domain-containing protein YfiP
MPAASGPDIGDRLDARRAPTLAAHRVPRRDPRSPEAHVPKHRPSPPPPPEARPYCYRCDKPKRMCLCGLLAPIANTVGVHILQHPHERHHAVGTTRLLRLGLQEVQVHVLDLKGTSSACAPLDLPHGASLLYPSDDALDLETLAPEDRPAHLVVIDGTWAQAHRIYRENPWVSALPKVRLSPAEGSRYRIRAEPRQECLSTVESVVAALRCVQPDLQGTETLVSAFDAMIDAQIAAAKGDLSPARRKRKRQSVPKAIPPVLMNPSARIVLVFAEAAPATTTPSATSLPPLAARLSAVSLDGSHHFDALIQPDPAPDAYLMALMGLEEGAFDSADTLPDAMAAFRAFCEAVPGAGPLALVSWEVWTQTWLERTMTSAAAVLLKGVWANVSRGRVPALDAVVDSLGLEPVEVPIPGRAGHRLGLATAMARHLLSPASNAP